MSLTHALKWSFYSELASKLVQPVVFIVLARMLTPEDFGVMSAALMVIAFSQIFWEAGMGKALIQRHTDINDAANVAFWVNLGLAAIIAGLIYIAASPIALILFQDPRVISVIHVMTAQVFLGALGSVQTALLQKEMGFRKLFWVRFASVSLPGIASIPLAWLGLGYWSLVAGTLVGQVLQVVMLWRLSLWRPHWGFRVPVAKEMGRFGAWVGLSGLMAWIYAWMDALIVGMYLGNHDLGLYRTGNQLSIMIFALIFGPVTPVFYSQLSKMATNCNSLPAAAYLVMRLISLISFPVAFLMLSLSKFIEQIVLGEEWIGVGHVVGVMALTHGISYITSMNGEVYRAAGRPNIETIVMAIPIPIYAAVYVGLAPLGLDLFLLGRFFSMLLLAVPIHIYFAYKIFNLPILKVARFVLYCGIVSSFVFILSRAGELFISNNIYCTLVTSIVAFLFAIGVLYYWQRNDIILVVKKMLYSGTNKSIVGGDKMEANA